MAEKRNNPGTVNTAHVRNTSDGVHEKPNPDGGTHVSAWDARSNRRISWNENPDGTITGVHSTKQDDTSKIDYKRGRR